MTDTADPIARADAALDGVTEGPWTYRPRKLDDWGEIRKGEYLFAKVAVLRLGDEELSKHRANGTDPALRDGTFIAASRQLVPDLRDALAAALARVEAAECHAEALEAENARLREATLATHPGDMHWLADDPEYPLECWSTPVEERWENPSTVFELMSAVSLPHIFVAERVLTVDDQGDPDKTEAAWFINRADADQCYSQSLDYARAATDASAEGGA